EAEPAYFVLNAGKAGQNENRRLNLGDAQGAQHLVTAHVGQIQIEKNDVIIIEFAEIDTLFTEIGGVDVETFGLQHQLDALRCRAVVLNKEYPHYIPLVMRSMLEPWDLACPRQPYWI